MLNLILNDQDIRQIITRLSIGLLVIFVLELLLLNYLSILGSIVSHGYLLYFCFKLSREFTSLFPLHIQIAVSLTFLAELTLLANSDYLVTSTAFSLFMLGHFLKNVVLSGKFFMNIYKSEIHNDIWLKILPYPCVGMLFILLQGFIYGRSTENYLTFFIYNAVACLTLLLAALRYNHTSYKGFFMMLLGILSLVISDIFFFTKSLESPEISITWEFRATFLLCGNMLMIAATYDHVIDFEKEFRRKIYFGADEEQMSKVRSNIKNVPVKPIQEPLI